MQTEEIDRKPSVVLDRTQIAEVAAKASNQEREAVEALIKTALESTSSATTS